MPDQTGSPPPSSTSAQTPTAKTFRLRLNRSSTHLPGQHYIVKLTDPSTRSSIAFESQLGGSRRVVLSLIPGDSDADNGLHFQLYKTRYAKVANIPTTAVEGLMPVNHHTWAYIRDGGPGDEGFEGFFRTNEDVDRLTSPLRATGLI
jgi:hypothetical protein